VKYSYVDMIYKLHIKYWL